MIHGQYLFGEDLYDQMQTMWNRMTSTGIPELDSDYRASCIGDVSSVSGKFSKVDHKNPLNYNFLLLSRERMGKITVFTLSEDSLEGFLSVFQASSGIDLRKLNTAPAINKVFTLA
jgi:hypothetical protein